MSFENIEQYLINPVVAPSNDSEGHHSWLQHLQLNLNNFVQSKFAGRVTTNGGNATEEFPVAGVTDDDFLQTNMHTPGSNAVSVVSSKCEDEKISITFSGDPGDDCVVDYMITKAR